MLLRVSNVAKFVAGGWLSRAVNRDKDLVSLPSAVTTADAGSRAASSVPDVICEAASATASAPPLAWLAACPVTLATKSQADPFQEYVRPLTAAVWPVVGDEGNEMLMCQ